MEWSSVDCAAPLRAIDRVLRLEPEGIVTRKMVTNDEPFFLGHYPGNPIYPGVFILETVHQSVRVYAERFHGRVRLAEAKSTRFLAPLRPGDVLECDCRCQVIAGGALQVNATCRREDVTAATLKLVYAVTGRAER